MSEISTVTDQVYQILREKIERQDIPPGTRLLDNEIAASLGVSRTPVRDTIGRLASEGLVTIIPRRGAFVTSLSAKAIKELYEIREALEVLAIRLAIPLLTDQNIAALQELLLEYDKALESDDYARHFEMDQRFHEQIIRLSGNEKLLELNKMLDGSIQITRWMHCGTGQLSKLALQEHRVILDALAARDTEWAVESLSKHICRVKQNLLEQET